MNCYWALMTAVIVGVTIRAAYTQSVFRIDQHETYIVEDTQNDENFVAEPQFPCSDRKEDPNSSPCPEFVDCFGEQNCSTPLEHVGCSDQEFQCKASKDCIAYSLTCNTVNNCQDGSDEENCECSRLPKRFECLNGECVNRSAVCDGAIDCTDKSDEFNCPGTDHHRPQPPQTAWREYWYEHKQNLTLANLSDHVALYFDSKTDPSITWPLTVLSNAWKYVKETYGQFGPDPLLYVVIHSGTYGGCHSNTYLHPDHTFHNIIDCGLLQKDGWATNSPSNVRSLLLNFGEIIQSCAKGPTTATGPGQDSTRCGNRFQDILNYDLLLKFGSEKETQSWKETTSKLRVNNMHCFKDWFLPVYEKYGGPSVLKKFYALSTSNGTLNRTTSAFPSLNIGEFVHFWNQAAGEEIKLSLSSLAENTIDSAWDKYPHFNYSESSDLTPDANKKDENEGLAGSTLAVLLGLLVPVLVIAIIALALLIKCKMRQEEVQYNSRASTISYLDRSFQFETQGGDEIMFTGENKNIELGSFTPRKER